MSLAAVTAGCGTGETPNPEGSAGDSQASNQTGDLPSEPTPATPAEPEKQPEAPVANAPPKQPEGLPWKTAESTPPPELFGAVAADSPSPRQDAEAEPEPASEEEGLDAFESFLLGAYGEEAPKDKTEPALAATESATSAEESNLPKPDPPALPPLQDLVEGKPANLDSAPPAETFLEPLPELPAASIAATPEPFSDSLLPESVAKPPTTTAAASAPTLDDLWADTPVAEAEPAVDEPAPGSVVPESRPLEPLTALEPTLPAVVETSPERVASPAVVSAPAPPIAETEAPARVATLSPRASGEIEPLPRLPVLAYNTRHLAWLLGAKFALAGLADQDGATPAEVAAWTDETRRLAAQLKVEVSTPNRTIDSTTQRVQRLLAQAGALSADLARRHGDDHAALLEIAVKTNALLVLAADRPELAEAVGRSVGNAAERALLPRFLWEETVRDLSKGASPETIHDAAVRLHQRVEPFLR